MANRYLDTKFVDKAIKFAVDAHSDTERRGKGFPYVIHVLEAMEIVATITSDPELLAAAALHDTVEDTSVTIGQIRAEFGQRVADLVDAESDRFEPGLSEQQTWRARKQAAIDRLTAASLDAKTVALGDKLSNMRAIARDYRKQGDSLWSLFHAPGGKADHEWHYRSLASALSELRGTDAYREFTSLVEEVFGVPIPEFIDINDYEESGAGFTAVSYNHKMQGRMIKLYADYIPLQAAQNEYLVSRTISSFGINIPKALRVITTGRQIGVEFERISPKKSYSRMIADDPSRLEELVKDFAGMCRRFHSIKCDTSAFPAIEAKFVNAVQKSSFDDELKRKVLDFIASVPRTDNCTHGDMHIGNVIINTDTLERYWIDLADFSYGNPLFDLGMFYFVSCCNPDEMVYDIFHLHVGQMRKVWEYFAREYFGQDVSISELDKKMAPFAALYMIYYGEKDKYYPGMKEYIKAAF